MKLFYKKYLNTLKVANKIIKTHNFDIFKVIFSLIILF